MIMNPFDLPRAPRLLLEAELSPIQGTRFQPTGFPDVGAGVYTLPDGKEQLLVESAQSVANRLELACWDEAKQDLMPELAGLPYVRVLGPEGDLLTTSLQEAHRLNSPYIERTDFFRKDLTAAIDFNDKRPNDRSKLITALARYDIGCLLHGVFLESIAGVLRVPRALSGFIEASDVQRVNTGGVKNDRVQASKDEDTGRTASEGFGNVPFHRTEFVAAKITAYFNLDLEQIRGYRLGADLERLLFALSIFKIRRFLESGLRLRTACDLSARELLVKAPSGVELPSLANTLEQLPSLITAARSHFAAPPITSTKFDPGEKKPAKKGSGK
ncbi:MAG TPA: type I-U CRISPR-associated RAMP protein Csb1/Cas7u [Polyangiaceae bacterium]|nr:type I-U CRISPR-associated RAMP protein Csb1/Cas7u [Polyangiaceae bacterium]